MMQSANRIVSSDAEALILVDAHDREIGELPKGEAHDGDGVLHRAFSVFLFNSNGELLLQQRAADKRLWPSFWSNSCCSHPRVGESMETATQRRLSDELNLDTRLKYLYRFRYQARFGDVGSEHELCHVYLGRVAETVVPNEREIAAVRFMPAEQIAAELATASDRYTPWFKLEWERLTGEFADVLAEYTAGRATS